MEVYWRIQQCKDWMLSCVSLLEDKAMQRLDVFLWKFIGGSSRFSKLFDTFEILLILSHHGEAHVERGFSVNSQIFVEHLYTKGLIAQWLINDHMVFIVLKSWEINITNKLLDHLKKARSRYFSSRKECSLQGLRSARDIKCRMTPWFTMILL